jgi:hypothetical protein
MKTLKLLLSIPLAIAVLIVEMWIIWKEDK